MSWQEAQRWEKDWHGNCINKVGGEWHQVTVIAPKMGLSREPNIKRTHTFDLQRRSVLDIGGGAASLLLKCVNVKGKTREGQPGRGEGVEAMAVVLLAS